MARLHRKIGKGVCFPEFRSQSLEELNCDAMHYPWEHWKRGRVQGEEDGKCFGQTDFEIHELPK